MEKQLFDWESWDDTGDYQSSFTYVTLKVRVGEYKEGTVFTSAGIDYGSGKLTFYNGNNLVATFQLKLTVE